MQKEIKHSMKIFVIGKLGELVKKVIEMEGLIADNPSNTLLITELAAYSEILNMCHIQDRKEFIQLCNISNLIEKEAAMRENTSLQFYDMHAKDKYLHALDAVRECLAKLNILGQYIGDSPYLEVDDADITRANG